MKVGPPAHYWAISKEPVPQSHRPFFRYFHGFGGPMKCLLLSFWASLMRFGAHSDLRTRRSPYRWRLDRRSRRALTR
jgi:hypothetical protein